MIKNVLLVFMGGGLGSVCRYLISDISYFKKFETTPKGNYAVGDICTYPGKLKLILSGFHEGALAARACFKLARPNEKYRFEFTTSSKTIKNRLGVKSD